METEKNALKTDNYLSYFYSPELTAYEFLKSFFACLKKQNVDKAGRDISGFLYDQKKKLQDIVALKEIRFRNNGIFWYSNDIEDALFNLQNGGLLGKTNPSFGVILIKYTDEEADNIIKNTPVNCIDDIKKIAMDYLDGIGTN